MIDNPEKFNNPCLLSVGETAVQPSPPVAVESTCSSADGEGTRKVDPQSLNSSLSSEHSPASSICSGASVTSARESRGTGKTTAAAGRKMAGKIPKPVSK